MKRILKVLLPIFAAISVAACESRLGSEELANSVLEHMQKEAASEINLTSLRLVREGPDSNKYNGVLKTSEPYGSFVYSVDVTYDGKQFTWEIVDDGSPTPGDAEQGPQDLASGEDSVSDAQQSFDAAFLESFEKSFTESCVAGSGSERALSVCGCVAKDLIESLAVDDLSDQAATQEYALAVSLPKCS